MRLWGPPYATPAASPLPDARAPPPLASYRMPGFTLVRSEIPSAVIRAVVLLVVLVVLVAGATLARCSTGSDSTKRASNTSAEGLNSRAAMQHLTNARLASVQSYRIRTGVTRARRTTTAGTGLRVLRFLAIVAGDIISRGPRSFQSKSFRTMSSLSYRKSEALLRNLGEWNPHEPDESSTRGTRVGNPTPVAVDLASTCSTRSTSSVRTSTSSGVGADRGWAQGACRWKCPCKPQLKPCTCTLELVPGCNGTPCTGGAEAVAGVGS